ncbi:hypothetical protein [Pseudanabaena sp. PCC 6802]|uniref:hypothetical protein n=1 Tax=Pseudanabaena sp. PCC 6802 TaxID=118173 RepID=UPI0012E9F8D3|nr:hypothetical protein [Pseudanabaena sp. PCC 6802]
MEYWLGKVIYLMRKCLAIAMRIATWEAHISCRHCYENAISTGCNTENLAHTAFMSRMRSTEK